MRKKPNTRAGTGKLPPLKAGEFRYGVAVRESDGLWLALEIKRTQKPAVYVNRIDLGGKRLAAFTRPTPPTEDYT